ncbi:MAG: hypothetical protein KIT57_14165 [Blastocatellales bacterium]|nr:hypothetical protein [Blastocatellales bacterium]
MNDESQQAAKNRLRAVLFYLTLALVSGIPRVWGAFNLPNAFGDAYTYYEIISVMRAKMLAGAFTPADLHGFWLPLYQFVSALFSLPWDDAFYASKLVGALCGTAVCLLVYQITFRLTSSKPLSLIAFAAIALSPLHIHHSASSLTDVPHALPVLGSLYFAMERRWRAAALCAAAAGFMRVESWFLILLLPALQLLVERRVSALGIAITLASPVLWFYVCWKATGNPMAYFEERNRYILEYTAANPAVTVFTKERLLLDRDRLFVSTNYAVFAGCIAAACIIVYRTLREGFAKLTGDLYRITAAAVLFLYNIGFLLLAYITGNQPDIWSRYGLLFFALGLPVLAWAYMVITRQHRVLPYLAAPLIALAFYDQAKAQMDEFSTGVNDERAREAIALQLKETYRDDSEMIYCDDGNVRFLSGIARDRFANQLKFPDEPESFLARLRELRVRYAVCTSWETSALTVRFLHLREGEGDENFEPVAESASKRSGLKIRIYRISKPPETTKEER